jgi:hypothetical protein
VRSQKWVVLGIDRQPGPNRVVKNIAGHHQREFVVSQHTLESIALPQSMSKLLGIVEAGVLLCTTNESLAVGRVGLALEEQMNMIRHVAVRRNFEPLLGGSTQNVRVNEIYVGTVDEALLAFMGAKREEIPMKADVVEGREVPWIPGAHV